MVDGDYIDGVREHIRSFFIKDENRIFPNDSELTDFMQRYHNSLHKVSYCKIFELGCDNRSRPRYKIIIHCSEPRVLDGV